LELLANGDKWTIDYVFELIPEKENVDGDFYAIYLTVSPGSILSIAAFLAFELPYLAKKRRQRKRAQRDLLMSAGSDDVTGDSEVLEHKSELVD
jgi:hypothetical protein